MNGFARLMENGNLALILGSSEKEDESITWSLLPLPGHIINGDVRGTFIDFKKTKTPADKKADRW